MSVGHQSKRTEGAGVVCSLGFVRTVSTMQIAFWMVVSMLQFNVFRARGTYRMGTMAWASPNLHLAARSYRTTGAQYLIITGTARVGAFAGNYVKGHTEGKSGVQAQGQLPKKVRHPALETLSKQGRKGVLLQRESSILR